MSDLEISRLVGLKTYCQLCDASPELYEKRVECCKFKNKSGLNEISPLLSENVDMKQIKEDLKYCVKTGKTLPTVKNLIGSSICYYGVALPRWYIILWICVVLFLVGLFSYILITSGLLHRILYKNFTPNMKKINFI